MIQDKSNFLALNGTLPEIAAQLFMIISQIYTAIPARDRNSFRHLFVNALQREDCPCWQQPTNSSFS